MIPSVLEDIPIPIERIPRHQGTDYAYIKALADEVGYVFYIDPGPVPGVSKAYWGPEIRLGAPQPALERSLWTGRTTTSRTSRFAFDKERKELPIVFIQEPVSKAPIPIPIPDVTPLNPPLGVVPPLPPKITFLKDTAKLNPLARGDARHRLRRQALGLGLRDRLARRRALRPRAPARGSSSACAARARRSTASTTSRRSPRR